jgi:hypothetical protein
MATPLDYALMAGSAYIVSRAEINRIPAPSGWAKVMNPDSYVETPSTGFEAISYQKGSEIVISYAGTDPASSHPTPLH